MFNLSRTITISFADFIAFNKIHFNRLRVKPRWIWLVISLLTIFIFCIGYSTDGRVSDKGVLFAIFFFVFLYAFISAAIWLFLLLVRMLHRLLLYIAYKLSSHTFVNIEVLINEKGIEYKTTKKHYIALWPQIIKVYDDGLRYIIYYAENAVFILPKHYIGDLEQRYQFANFLKAYTNPDLKYVDSSGN
ncbi:MAG: YcxB family protein [Dysgonomonas sp.]|nr:YcxB family protein [Dysgonomonas sp.]